MDYQEIKQRLSEAGRLVDAGKVAEADAMIRTMLGKGLTGMDLQANLTPTQLRALRKHDRSKAD